MELTEAMELGRRFLNERGLAFFNLFAFDLPSPAGFRYRNNIGLNQIFVRTQDAGAVADVILHEAAHGYTDDGETPEENREHGLEFQACAERFGGHVDPTFIVEGPLGELVALYNREPVLRNAGGRCMVRICQELAQWSDSGVKGRDDAETFLQSPYLIEKGA
ncbi:MAG TPA: SprT-like domain-containing protein [Acidobacteriota bacterium]|nr:SprT-like domain-containing protein [Acidobacteriota bacterium]